MDSEQGSHTAQQQQEDAGGGATTVWRSPTVAGKVTEAGPASSPSTAPTEVHTDPTATVTADAAAAAQQGESAVATTAAAAAIEDGAAGEGEDAKKSKKPVLISRKADFNVAEMMRQLREGEVERSVQPAVKTTNVVKKEKPKAQQPPPQQQQPQPQAPAQRAPAPAPRPAASHGDNGKKQQAPPKGKTAVVVVTATGGGGTYADKLKGEKQQQQQQEPAVKTTGEEEEGSADKGTKTPPPPQSAGGGGKQGGQKNSAAGSAKASPVKQGSVKKRSKKEVKQTAAADEAPAPHVTTVKAKMSLEELRALRNRGSTRSDPKQAGELSAAAASKSEGEARIIDEISSLLLRYCMGSGAGGGGTSEGKDGKLDKKSWPTLGEDSAGTAMESTEATTEESGIAAATAANPEMELYNRLTELCQDENVTSSTLDLLHELLKHTRVIPLRPQSAEKGNGDDAGSNEADAAAEDASRRRLYAQQIVLVLINQMKQKKLMEEQRRELLRLQQQQRSTSGATKLSAFSAPFVPTSLATTTQQQTHGLGMGGSGSHVTTFAPQSTFATTTTTPAMRIPSLAAGGANITVGGVRVEQQHQSHPYSGRAVPPPPQQQATAAPRQAGSDTEGQDMKQLLDALRDRLVQSTTEPTVSISQEERRVLREIQQNFKLQQQQQRQLTNPSSSNNNSTLPAVASNRGGGGGGGGVTPASIPSSKTTPLSFDANKAASLSSTTPADGDSVASNTQHQRHHEQQQRHGGAPNANRTVFTYKTLIYDPSSSSAEDVPALASHLHSQPGDNVTTTTTTFNRNAKPFVPGGGGGGGGGSSVAAGRANTHAVPTTTTTPMNAAAPAFVPPSVAAAAAASSGPAPSARPAASKTSVEPPPPPAPQQPWASPEMFAQWKKSMEDYYRTLTYSQFAAAMQQQQQQQPR